MLCPKCNGRSKVYDTERRPEGTMRRRQCMSGLCGAKFKTIETPARLVTGYVVASDEDA
ncbi:MAG: hypothetical protein M9894_17130 [Planctomycetes bacterium]|nr:hypothetical protein [Planctomycetota bacterium]